jgi:hypothetical protein
MYLRDIVCLRYIIVNTLHKGGDGDGGGDNDDYDDNNNSNNNNGQLESEVTVQYSVGLPGMVVRLQNNLKASV